MPLLRPMPDMTRFNPRFRWYLWERVFFTVWPQCLPSLMQRALTRLGLPAAMTPIFVPTGADPEQVIDARRPNRQAAIRAVQLVQQTGRPVVGHTDAEGFTVELRVVSDEELAAMEKEGGTLPPGGEPQVGC